MDKTRFLILPPGNVRKGYLVKTGQTTQYASMADDGFFEKGQSHRYTILTAGQYSGTTNITINAKTDAHSNACVMDSATGLMWSRTISASVGAASDGKIPWTTAAGEGIFAYADAANAATLAGYTDWRIPNDLELLALRRMEATSAIPDSTAFPAWTFTSIWSSTTAPNNTANAMAVLFSSGNNSSTVKTTTNFAILVRGPY